MTSLKLTVSKSVRRFFIDRKAVRDGLDKATINYLHAMGKAIFKASKKSIKSRTGKRSKHVASTADNPPYSHMRGRDAGIRRILYAVDGKKKVVTCGPTKWGAAKGRDVPNVLEFGGMREVERRSQRGTVTGVRRVRFAARPFMYPALEAEAPKAPQVFRKMVDRQRFRSARRRS